MSWDGWLQSLLVAEKDGKPAVSEAAICCHEPGQEAVWASTPGFRNITPEEIKRIANGGNDLYVSGPVICGQKCQLIRNLLDDPEHCMDLKTKCDNHFVVTIGKTLKTFVMAKGAQGVHAGQISMKVNYVVTKLRESGY